MPRRPLKPVDYERIARIVDYLSAGAGQVEHKPLLQRICRWRAYCSLAKWYRGGLRTIELVQMFDPREVV